MQKFHVYEQNCDVCLHSQGSYAWQAKNSIERTVVDAGGGALGIPFIALQGVSAGSQPTIEVKRDRRGDARMHEMRVEETPGVSTHSNENFGQGGSRMSPQLEKHFGRFIFVALACALFASVAPAQDWQDFKRPAPAAADWAAIAKLPDFTGVWEMPLGGGGKSLIERPGAAKQNAPRAVGTSGRPAAAEQQPSLPLTPAWVAQMKYLEAHPPQDNPQANCVPNGMPEIMRLPYPYEFLFTPGQVTIIGELYRMVRHIYTDGRSLPKDPDPSFWGTSVGHWEGQTLVAETVGLLPQTDVIPGSGIEKRLPHSDKMKLIERFRLLDPDTMQIKTTIIDPVVFTRPYTTSWILKRHPTWTIDEYICEQNNRNSVTSSGKAEVDTIPPPPSGADPNFK